MSECKECPKLKKQIAEIEQSRVAVELRLKVAEDANAKNVEAFKTVSATLDARARELAQAKDRNREVVKARNDAIANRDDALAEIRKLQDKCKALQDELAEARKEGGGA